MVVIGVGGMGEAIARRSGSGKTLLLADFNEELLGKVSSELSRDGYEVATAVVDVSSRDSVASLADRAAETGRVMAVAHTAGISSNAATAVLAVDLLGVAHTLDEFARVIEPGGSGIVIASMAGTMAQGRLPQEAEHALATTPTESLLDLPFLAPELLAKPGAAYSTAKRANQLRVQGAAVAWGARGARVNSISPGIIATPMGTEELQGEASDMMHSMIQKSPSKRLGTAGDIAAAAAFLLGSDSTFITGTDLLVDGGVIASQAASSRP